MAKRRLETYGKTPTEDKQYGIDYRKWLLNGETIVSAVATVQPSGLVDPAVSPLVVSACQPNVTNDGVMYVVEGGDDGETYTVIITATTSEQQIEQDWATFRVRAIG